MFDSPDFLYTLLGTLIPSLLYAIALWFFAPRRPKLLSMSLLFLVGAVLIAPCYMAEFALDIAFPWGSSGHLMWNILPSAILEEGAKLLCLAFAFRMLIERSDRWQYFFTSGFVLGSGFMFMENFVCMVQYGDVYMLLENRTWVVEMTDPLFGGIAGIGLFLILNGRWYKASLFILLPIALHFCHNLGVIVLGGVPWWPLYFLGYTSMLLVFAWEYLCISSETESPAEKTILAGNGSLRFLRKV
ncbi:MAG: PrsW family glutamic-type intramembrane protease [Victivallales bacterium]